MYLNYSLKYLLINLNIFQYKYIHKYIYHYIIIIEWIIIIIKMLMNVNDFKRGVFLKLYIL